MAKVNGNIVERVVAEAMAGALREDAFVATQPVKEGLNYSFVALREEQDDEGKGVTIGVKITVQPAVPVWDESLPF